MTFGYCVLFNNCYGDKAVVNAREVKGMIEK